MYTYVENYFSGCKSTINTCFCFFYSNTNATFFAAQRGSSSYRSLDFVEYSSMMFATLTCGGTETDIGFCTVDYNTSSCGASNNVPVGIDCSGISRIIRSMICTGN